jgi:ERF superfamily
MTDYQQQAEHEQQQWLVYQKLQQARIKLQSTQLKKSGHNKFAGYQYFELGDFLPTINQIFAELKLCSTVSFDENTATLKIFDHEFGGLIRFTSPMAEAQLKGCHPVQNLGATQTYLRRYLYVLALEIVEHDALDATTGSDAPKASKPVTVDVYDSMSTDDQDIIDDIAVEVRWMIEKGDIEGAVQYINEQQLDADFKTALWSRFDSKQRSALKKASVK